MTPQEIDRIQNAIRHIQTAVDVDPWARDIAVEAMEAHLSAKGTTLVSRQAAIDALSTPHGILYPIRTVEELPAAQPELRLSCKNCVHLGHGYMMPCKNCKRNQMLPDWYEVETERKKND